jgi:chromosome segregation ATPase
MGAMATTNLFTVENMRSRIKKSNHTIAQLQDQLKNAEKNIREEVNKSLEQARAIERQEIQSLKSSLDEMNQRIQASQVQVTQQEELIKQLQAKLNLTEGRVVDSKAFQTLSLEAHTKIEAEQQKLISKIEIIQNYFQEVSKSLDNIILLEKEAKEARNTFQKVVVCSGNKEVSKNLKLSVTEQIRGDIMLKAWETNISENKKIVKEIKDDCEGIFDSLDKQALGIERNDFSEPLGQINIVKQQLNCKEGLQEIQAENFTVEGNQCQPNRQMAGTAQFKIASDQVCR